MKFAKVTEQCLFLSIKRMWVKIGVKRAETEWYIYTFGIKVLTAHPDMKNMRCELIETTYVFRLPPTQRKEFRMFEFYFNFLNSRT